MHAPTTDPTHVDGRGHGASVDFFIASDDLVPLVQNMGRGMARLHAGTSASFTGDQLPSLEHSHD
jgi:hypothetical protein